MPIMNGSSYASYAVRLSRAATATVAINWRTEAGTAEPGEDYEETQGTVTFAPGETEKTIQVLVYGRAPGDDEPRDFSIRLSPTPGVVLGAETSQCVITVVDEDGVTIAAVTVANGPAGKSAYEIAKIQGFTGTAAEWLASLKGAPGDPGEQGDPGEAGPNGKSAYELAVDDGFVGSEAEWLETLRGETGEAGEPGIPGTPGSDGRAVEFQKGTTHLQWRYVGDVGWTNLVALADIKGDAGTGLRNRNNWEAGTYEPGDYVFSAGSSAATSMWILLGDVDYVSTVEPADDPTHWIEFEAPAGPPGADGSDGEPGADGVDGKQVELQKTATHIQWRYVGDAGWTNLVALADIKGADGAPGAAGSNGAAGAKWFSGAGAPGSGTGVQGDYYLNVTNGDVYGPKGASSWGSASGNIKGPQGDAGSGGGGSSSLYALMQADVGVTETTLVDVMSFTVESGKVYQLRGSIVYRTTATSKGMRVGMGGTAGVQSISVAAKSFDSSGNLVGKHVKAKATAMVFTTSAIGGDDNLMELHGLIYATGAGTITIQIGAAVQYDYCAAQKGSAAVLEPIGTITA